MSETNTVAKSYDSVSFAKHVDELPRVNSLPTITGTIRSHFSDFEVTEQLSFEPCGEGEHLFLYIEKQSCNSQWVADELQKYFKLRSQDIGYAGKKDRASISRQWFSCHLPGKNNEIDNAVIDALNNDSFKVLKFTRHNKKLRKGVIKNNHFKIKVSQLSGKVDKNTLENIQKQGFPNYFGYQRFGFNGNNLIKALQLFNNEIRVRSRNKKGLYFSAARSFLFNLMVAERIKQHRWAHILTGDCLTLAGSQSYFLCPQPDDELTGRLENGDLNISGLLVGSQPSQASAEALAIEAAVLEQHPQWLNSLTKAGLQTGRRAIRVIPENIKYQQNENNSLTIEFSLPAGSFATSLLRELFIIKDAALNKNNRDKPDSEEATSS